MSGSPQSLDVRVEAAADLAIVTVTGDVGFGNAPTLLQHGAELAARRVKRVIIDLSAVSYMDSSGVGTLVQIKRLVEQAGGALVLAAMQARVRDVFEITHLQHFFRIVHTLAEARGA